MMSDVVRDTHAIGDRAVARFLTELLKIHRTVLMPFGEGHRYDLVADDKGSFIRIQVKSGRLHKGVVEFRTCSAGRDYRGEVDFFGVYCPDNDKCYLVPCSHVGRTVAHLRVIKTRNGQSKGIRFASDYEI